MNERLKALIEADPEAAIKLLQGLSDKVVIPHDGGQKDVLNCEARFQILDAGRRWGKTKIGAKKAVKEARLQRKMIWWVAPTYKVVKRGYNEVLRQLPPELLVKPAPPDTAFDAGRAVILKFKTGSRMEFYSAERPEGMLGEGVDFAVLDEAAIMAKHIWEQIVRPTLMDKKGGALMISTPRGQNWFYNAWLRGQSEKNPEWASWQFPTWSNPYIAPEEIEEMRATLPSVIFEQEVAAEFISDAAAVFRYGADAIVGQVKPKGQVYMGIDLAKSRDFTVISAVNGDSRRPCYHDKFNSVSWPDQLNRIKGAVHKILKDGAEDVTLAVDSTGVGDPICDDLELEGYDVVPVKFTNQWKQQAVMLLSSDLERGNAYIEECQTDEFQIYSYEHNHETGRTKYAAPEGAHDDEVSAKLLQHWALVNFGTADVRVLDLNEPVEMETPEETLSDDEFMDYSNEEESLIKDGQITHTTVRIPSVAERMNNPNSWA